MWWRASPRPNFWHCASEKSKKQSKVGPPNPISLAKRNNVAMAIECAKLAREILGANGITYSYPPGRHLLNLETVLTYEGTHEIHTLIVGQDITGLDAFG
ncbi:MAG: acyl-CoA dehydrogenase family protein [Deltaproteobacteria bacterium]|nr:acyl-CoA dehydrogenase family protein [Deltaproteobacteria bacterium]